MGSGGGCWCDACTAGVVDAIFVVVVVAVVAPGPSCSVAASNEALPPELSGRNVLAGEAWAS